MVSEQGPGPSALREVGVPTLIRVLVERKLQLMMTKKKLFFILLGMSASALVGAGLALAQAVDARITRYDQGPATIDVSKYPAAIQEDYTVFSQKCSQCHKLSRPINSDFVLPDEWSRYIHRMMSKPASGIGGGDGKKIYDFLVYDSSVRKKKAQSEKLQTLTPDERKKAEDAIKAVVDKYK